MTADAPRDLLEPPDWLAQATAASESRVVSRDVLRHFLRVALKELAYRTEHERLVVAADTEAIVSLRADLARRDKEGSEGSSSETSANKPQHAAAFPADAPRYLLEQEN